MPLKTYKPTSPGRRGMSSPDNAELTKGKRPERKLTAPLRKSGGRNSYGHITSRHIGGGHKRRYRIIDWKRNKDDIEGKVVSIEYDPNRSARIALIQYLDGEKRYILWPEGLKVGDRVISGEDVDPQTGNALPLRSIPLGAIIHNVELKPGRGGQLIRSAGGWGQLMAKEGKFAQIRLPSGEVRMVLLDCRATIGSLGHAEHATMRLGKAGRSRWLGRRPRVRGVAMNPVDHPHGGGEGKAAQGNPHPVTPWGMPTKGYKTRKNKNTDKFIVKRRK